MVIAQSETDIEWNWGSSIRIYPENWNYIFAGEEEKGMKEKIIEITIKL